MRFDLVSLAYISQTVNLADIMSLEFRVILNIALRCPAQSVLPCLFFTSAALPSPNINLYVLTLHCATLNFLTIPFQNSVKKTMIFQPTNQLIVKETKGVVH